MATSPIPKRQETTTTTANTEPYTLIYWPSIPGRGEHLRILFEATSTPYTDTALTTGAPTVLAEISASNLGDADNPPICAPPILKHGNLTICQTPNILLYLGTKLDLAGDSDDGVAKYHVNQLALTALDGLSNEPHDCHHPIATGLYYEDQIPEAKRKAEDYVKNRLPKFLGYFERVLKGEKSGGGEWLYSGRLTYADLVLWQCMDGLRFMFPGAMMGMEEEDGKYERVFALYARVGSLEAVAAYLESERRMKYGNGIYRYYEELQF